MDAYLIMSVLMLIAWVGVGLFMILAPRRFGNLAHEGFLIFPAIDAHDWGKKLFWRLVCVGLLAFAAHTALRMLELFRSLAP